MQSARLIQFSCDLKKVRKNHKTILKKRQKKKCSDNSKSSPNESVCVVDNCRDSAIESLPHLCESHESSSSVNTSSVCCAEPVNPIS